MLVSNTPPNLSRKDKIHDHKLIDFTCTYTHLQSSGRDLVSFFCSFYWSLFIIIMFWIFLLALGMLRITDTAEICDVCKCTASIGLIDCKFLKEQLHSIPKITQELKHCQILDLSGNDIRRLNFTTLTTKIPNLYYLILTGNLNLPCPTTHYNINILWAVNCFVSSSFTSSFTSTSSHIEATTVPVSFSTKMHTSTSP